MNKQDYEYLQSIREFELLLHQKIDLSLELINIEYAKSINKQGFGFKAELDKLINNENCDYLDKGFEFLKEFINKELNRLNDKYLQISFLNQCKNISYEYLKDYFIVNNFTGGSYLMFYIFSKVLNVTKDNINKRLSFNYYSNKTIIVFSEPRYYTNDKIPIEKTSLQYNEMDKQFNQLFGGGIYSYSVLRTQNILTKEKEIEFEKDFIINNPIHYKPENTLGLYEYRVFRMIYEFPRYFLDKEKFILKNDKPMKFLSKDIAEKLANDLSDRLINKQDFINFLTGEEYTEVKTTLDRNEVFCLFKLLINEKFFTEKYLKNNSNILYEVRKKSKYANIGDYNKVNITSNLTTLLKKIDYNFTYKQTIDIFEKYFDVRELKERIKYK